MNNLNDNNSECGFEKELAAYLYDEIDFVEKRVVEAHLSACQSCAREFQEISAARASVNSWYLNEFTQLALPVIKFDSGHTKAERKTKSVSAFLQAWRFPLPAFAAVLAFLVIGSVYFLRQRDASLQTVRVAAPSSGSFAAKDTSIGQPARATSESKNIVAEALEMKKSPEVKSATPVARRTYSARTRSAGGARASRVRQNLERSPERNSQPSDRSVAAEKQNDLELSGFDETEDETLRLGDILSEIDAG